MRRLLLKLLRRRRMEHDLEAELAFHREMARAHDNPVPLGNASALKDAARDLWRFTLVENLWRDLVQAARGLRRNPVFTASALASLALGIGVNTTLFSLGVELMLSEPSVRDVRSLVYVRLGEGSHTDFETLRLLRDSRVFAEVAGEREESFVIWNEGTETRRLFSAQATRNYFDVVGVPVALGRGWTEADPEQVAVLSHRLWLRRFAGDPAVVGRTIRLNDQAFTVLGVLPETYRSLWGFGLSPEIYVPRHNDEALGVYARLAPGQTLGDARAAVQGVARQLDASRPRSYGRRADAVSVTTVDGLGRLENRNIGSLAAFFGFLLGLAGLVLLIACINVAGLLLARASTRRREIAVRVCLGASRGRLLQQLLTESLLLAAAGAGLGFVLALATARGLAALPLPLPVPIELHIQPDARVAVYAAVLAVVATLVAGLLPAWQTARDSFVAGLQRERRMRARRTLVVAQIAASFVVLTAGALFLQNLWRATAISPGFDTRNTARADVQLPPAAYVDRRRVDGFVDDALRALEGVPGVSSAAAARIVPLTDANTARAVLTWTDTGERVTVTFNWNAVSSGYFRTMDIAVRRGREFEESDRDGSRVVVVNATFAQRHGRGGDPVGATFLWGDDPEPFRVVGVVADTKNVTVGEEDRPQVYQPLSQAESDLPRVQFVVRSAIPPALQLAPLRQALRRVEPAAGLEVETMFSSIGMAFLPSQLGAALMGALGALGLLLSAIGLYGVLAYTVAQRTREFGIRMAVGARPSEIARIVLSGAMRMLGAGVGLGLAVALFATRPLGMFLMPGLSPTDPLAFAAVAALLALVAAAAVAGPARRATSIDPARCLRRD
jgi:predicted permease